MVSWVETGIVHCPITTCVMRSCHTHTHGSLREKTRKLGTNLVTGATTTYFLCPHGDVNQGWLVMFTIYCLLIPITALCWPLYYHGALSKVCLDNILQHLHNIYGSDLSLTSINPSHPPITRYLPVTIIASTHSLSRNSQHFIPCLQ